MLQQYALCSLLLINYTARAAIPPRKPEFCALLLLSAYGNCCCSHIHLRRGKSMHPEFHWRRIFARSLSTAIYPIVSGKFL